MLIVKLQPGQKTLKLFPLKWTATRKTECAGSCTRVRVSARVGNRSSNQWLRHPYARADLEKRWKRTFKLSICWPPKPGVSTEGAGEWEELEESNSTEPAFLIRETHPCARDHHTNFQAQARLWSSFVAKPRDRVAWAGRMAKGSEMEHR